TLNESPGGLVVVEQLATATPSTTTPAAAHTPRLDACAHLSMSHCAGTRDRLSRTRAFGASMRAMPGGRVPVGLLLPVLLSACAHTESMPLLRDETPREPISSSPEPAPRQEVQVGYATWYGARFAGRTTAD